ncbi:hypothetical protein GW17_00052319 [Ensete ventricosum]|nr:hypothetical protein GW17_00052319 [Ensete ventricosum]
MAAIMVRDAREIQPIGSPSSHLGNSVLIRVYPFRVQQAAGSDEGWLQLLATVGQGCDRGGYGRCDYGKGKKMRRARLEVTGRGEKA